jgi:hypothetical protein
MLGYQPDLRHAEPHVQIEGRGQCRGHIVANFVKKHKRQYQQHTGPAAAVQVFGEGGYHRLSQAGVLWQLLFGLGYH